VCFLELKNGKLEIKENSMRKLTFMTLALGLFIGAANADWPVWSGSIYDIYITNPVPVGDGSEDLESFIIRAVNTTGNSGYDPTQRL
jgi:hypothetical protein